MGTSGEHWLDLLAARQTRRRLLKTALAGAALTLPFASSAHSGGARTDADCSKPCNWTRGQNFSRRRSGCFANTKVTAYASWWLLGPLGVPVLSTAQLSGAGCLEVTALRDKAAAWDCKQPNCSGYDPKEPGGPCEGYSGLCCPCSGCDAGFIECAAGLCCNKAGTGCAYGSDCGG